LTDGKITVGKGKDGQGEDELLSLINTLDSTTKATIFTYTLGEEDGAPEEIELDPSRRVPKNIACAHKGIWEHVKDDEALYLKDKMASYYQYIATGLVIENVVWSEPYIDANGLGELTTGSLPVYV